MAQAYTSEQTDISDLPKVLVVDDRSENLFALKTLMHTVQADVRLAASGNEALTLMLEDEFAVVLLDVQMPEMDGFETASLMRSNPATRNTPIIFVTAYSQDRDSQLRGYANGAVDYLLKPVDPVALLCKVQVFIDLHVQRIKLASTLSALGRESKRNSLILDCAQEGIIGFSAEGVIVFANSAAAQSLQSVEGFAGLHISEVAACDEFPWDGSTLQTVVEHGGDLRNVEGRFRSVNDNSFPVEYSVATLSSDQSAECGIGGVIAFHDITQRKHAERELLRMARSDLLTGLANRTMFRESLVAAMARSRRSGHVLGLLIIDLDHFKDVNDSFGHDAGDELLFTIAERLKANVRTGDVVARLGGDEFAAILDDVENERNASLVANKLVEAISVPSDFRGRKFSPSCSIGVATYQGEETTPENFVKMADTALFTVKRRGRKGVSVYSAHVMEEARRFAGMKDDLSSALDTGAIVPFFQPQKTSIGGTLAGLEALARWCHPERGNISPGEFIPIAEETGQIVRLGEVMLERSLEMFAPWLRNAQIPADCVLSVNLSARQLREPSLAEWVFGCLESCGVPSVNIELEITETAVMQDVTAARRCLEELRSGGVRIAIDDFGTGYSSLVYLQQFPISTLKIDRSFVARIGQRRSDDTIIKAILKLASELSLRVVAEGVETEEQAMFLSEHGCQLLQGFLFAPALPAARLEEMFLSSADSAQHAVIRA